MADEVEEQEGRCAFVAYPFDKTEAGESGENLALPTEVPFIGITYLTADTLASVDLSAVPDFRASFVSGEFDAAVLMQYNDMGPEEMRFILNGLLAALDQEGVDL